MILSGDFTKVNNKETGRYNQQVEQKIETPDESQFASSVKL
jgi:hypothetical protein